MSKFWETNKVGGGQNIHALIEGKTHVFGVIRYLKYIDKYEAVFIDKHDGAVAKYFDKLGEAKLYLERESDRGS